MPEITDPEEFEDIGRQIAEIGEFFTKAFAGLSTTVEGLSTPMAQTSDARSWALANRIVGHAVKAVRALRGDSHAAAGELDAAANACTALYGTEMKRAVTTFLYAAGR